eukprot:4504238-Prymnesium_polylepis.2
MQEASKNQCLTCYLPRYISTATQPTINHSTLERHRPAGERQKACARRPETCRSSVVVLRRTYISLVSLV